MASMHDLECALADAVSQPLQHTSAAKGLPDKAYGAEAAVPMGDIEAPVPALPQPVRHTGTRMAARYTS